MVLAFAFVSILAATQAKDIDVLTAKIYWYQEEVSLLKDKLEPIKPKTNPEPKRISLDPRYPDGTKAEINYKLYDVVDNFVIYEALYLEKYADVKFKTLKMPFEYSNGIYPKEWKSVKPNEYINETDMKYIRYPYHNK